MTRRRGFDIRRTRVGRTPVRPGIGCECILIETAVRVKGPPRDQSGRFSECSRCFLLAALRVSHCFMLQLLYCFTFAPVYLEIGSKITLLMFHG